jgi:hypothetical protein
MHHEPQAQRFARLRPIRLIGPSNELDPPIQPLTAYETIRDPVSNLLLELIFTFEPRLPFIFPSSI